MEGSQAGGAVYKVQYVNGTVYRTTWGLWVGRGACLCTCTLRHLFFSFKVDRILRQALSAPGLAAMSAVVIHNDTVLWTGNFGRKNGSDPASGPPNEYTMYRSAGGPPGSCGGGEEW